MGVEDGGAVDEWKGSTSLCEEITHHPIRHHAMPLADRRYPRAVVLGDPSVELHLRYVFICGSVRRTGGGGVP